MTDKSALFSWSLDKSLLHGIKALRGVLELDLEHPKQLREQQTRLNRLGAGFAIMGLISNATNLSRELLFEALKFANALLRDGNTGVQQKIFEYLTTTQGDETFFEGVTFLFKRSVEHISEKKLQRLFLERQNSIDSSDFDSIDESSHSRHSASAPANIGRLSAVMDNARRSQRNTAMSFGGASARASARSTRAGSFTSTQSGRSRHNSVATSNGRHSFTLDGMAPAGVEADNAGYDDYEGEATSALEQSSVANSAPQSQADDMDLMSELIEYLRLLCEGHFLENQNYLRHQSDNLRSYNMLDEVASYLRALQWVINPYTNKAVWNLDLSNANLCHRILRCLVEFVQGNEKNPVALAQHQLVFCLNDIFRSSTLEPVCPESIELLSVIKGEALLLLFSLLEGCTNPIVATLLTKMCDFDAILEFLRDEEHTYRTVWERIEKSQTGSQEAKYTRMAARHQPIFHHRRGSIAMRHAKMAKSGVKTDGAAPLGSNNGPEVVENVLASDGGQDNVNSYRGRTKSMARDDEAVFGDDGRERRGGCCGDGMMGGEDLEKKDLVERVKSHKERCCMGAMLVRSLTAASPSYNDSPAGTWPVPTRAAWHRYLDSWSHLVASVEIYRNQRLEQVFFMIPEELLEARATSAIQESTRKFMLDVYSGDHTTKIRRFHLEGDLLLDEMEYVAGLQANEGLYMISGREGIWANYTFLLAIILNVIFLATSFDKIGGAFKAEAAAAACLGAIQFCHIVLSVLRLIAYCTNRHARFLSHDAHQHMGDAQRNLISDTVNKYSIWDLFSSKAWHGQSVKRRVDYSAVEKGMNQGRPGDASHSSAAAAAAGGAGGAGGNGAAHAQRHGQKRLDMNRPWYMDMKTVLWHAKYEMTYTLLSVCGFGAFIIYMYCTCFSDAGDQQRAETQEMTFALAGAFYSFSLLDICMRRQAYATKFYSTSLSLAGQPTQLKSFFNLTTQNSIADALPH